MTELTITPKVADKTARFKGAVAAGEHVAVTIKGGAAWLGDDAGANLTLRVLDLVTGRTLAVFPYWTEDNSEDWPEGLESADAWAPATDDANDLYCELNLNTTRMVVAARHMLRVPVMFVLGDAGDPRTLYFRDRYEVEYWPERIGDTVPYDLDKWPKKIDDWTELITGWTAKLNGMKLTAVPFTGKVVSGVSKNGVTITLNDGDDTTDTVVDLFDGEVSAAQMNAAIAAMGATKVDKTTTVNGHALSSNVTITKADVGLGDVANTGDSATPVSGGTTKFTTGGAYTELAKKADKVAGATNGHFAGLDSSGNLKDSGKKASDFATAADKASLQTAISDEATARSNADTSLGDRITTLENKVPGAASSSNQLADKAFVNSSIGTNTANYISNNGEPFASVAAMNAYSGTKTNNDYAFVVGEDSDGNTTYTRYKWDGSQWAEEYVLNNSSFTAAQWAAISSGITANAVTKLNGVEAGAQVNVIETVKVNGTALVPTGKAVDVNVPFIDPALAQQGAAADAKAVGDALRGGFTEWVCDEISEGWEFVSCVLDTSRDPTWIVTVKDEHGPFYLSGGSDEHAVAIQTSKTEQPNVRLSRHLITPTKTSQLTNDSGFITSHQDISGKLDGAAAYLAWSAGSVYTDDSVVFHKGKLWKTEVGTEAGDEPGVASAWEETTIDDLKQDALSSQQIGYINAVPGKADKAVTSAAGNLASLTSQGNLADSGVKPSDLAAKADLPYRLVEPGKWEFSDGQAHTITGPAESIGGYNYYADSVYASQDFDTEADALDALMLDFTEFTATRASLTGHLLDRAVNRVEVTGATTLMLPALVNAGKARDFLVKVTTSADDLNITWQGQGSEAPNGADELQFVTEDGDFPVVGTAGDYLFSFTEIEAHTFAVSMKPIVAAPQAQGGS